MRSNFERSIDRDLSLLTKRRNVLSYEYEGEKLEYTLVKNYVPDFIITFKNGKKIYIEAKGYFKKEDRVKLLAVKEAHPALDLRLVFQRNNKLHSRSKTTYIQWAETHGFPYSVGGVPKEWFKGK